MCLLKMGGIDGRRYYPSKVSQARANTAARQYMKYEKPKQDAQVDVGRLTAQALGATYGIATSYNPLDWINKAETAGDVYDFFDPRTFEARRMAGNAPGDLSGMAYRGKTRVYNQ